MGSAPRAARALQLPATVRRAAQVRLQSQMRQAGRRAAEARVPERRRAAVRAGEVTASCWFILVIPGIVSLWRLTAEHLREVQQRGVERLRVRLPRVTMIEPEITTEAPTPLARSLVGEQRQQPVSLLSCLKNRRNSSFDALIVLIRA